MKKIKHLILAIILILILFPTCAQAATEDEVSGALTSFIKGMENWNFTNNEKEEVISLLYDNNYKYGSNVAISEASFIDYVYNRVLGIDMKQGENLKDTDDFVDDWKSSGGIFEKVSAADTEDLTKELVDQYFKPGDIVARNHYFVVITSRDYMIYLGNYQFARFDSDTGRIVITDINSMKDYDVSLFRLNDATYNSISIKAEKPTPPTSTTIENEFKNLGLTATLVKTDYGYSVQLNQKLSDIIGALKRGYCSQHGDTPGAFSATAYIVYGDGSATIESATDYELGYFSSYDKGNTINSVMPKNKILIDEYEKAGYASPYANYFKSQGSKSLSLKLDFLYASEITMTRIIEITNGKEIDHEIEAFTNGIIADAPLSDFTGIKVEIDDKTKEILYQLDFTNEKTNKITREVNDYFKTNEDYQILFKVNKSGNYVIKENGKDLNNTSVYKGVYDQYNQGYYTSVSGTGANPSTLRLAGKVIEGKYAKSGRPVGEYVDPTDEEGYSYAYPLMQDEIYIIALECLYDTDPEYIEIELVSEPLNGKLVEILDENDRYRRTSQENIGVIVAEIEAPTPETIFDKLEHLLSFCIRGIANGIVYMINLVLGAVGGEEQQVTIDTIVFNQYKPVQLAFFKQGTLEPGVFVSDFSANIIKWYNIFTEIAIVGYLIMLLYMGIRIVLNSTAGKKAMYKELFVQWVTGLVILFTFPIVIRYAIEINNAIVGVAESSVEGSLSSGSAKEAEIIPDEASTVAEGDIQNEQATAMEENPFEDSDKGYMAVMSNRAHNSKKLVYAVVYLIMAFQLMIIAIMYYKRLFMVAFLIVLFPLVMLMFVLEKVGNVRTGAFSRWTKEIFITIFIQSIHAIIYAFTMTAVSNAGDTDWFLILVGVTFLFNGEEILKKILGQQSEVTPSLAQTAATTAAAFMAVKGGTQRLADNVIGAGSHLGKAIGSSRQAKKDGLIAENFVALGTPQQSLSDGAIGKYKNLGHYNQELELAQARGETEVNDLNKMSKAVFILNHRFDASPKQIADALKVVNDNRKNGKFLGMMKDLNISENQLVAIERAKGNAINSAISGRKTTQEIDMELTAELERILPNEGANVLAAAVYSQIGKVDINAQRNAVNGGTTFNGRFNNDRNLDTDKIRKEISDARERKNNIKDSIKISKTKSKTNDGLEESAVKMLERTYGTDMKVSKDKMKMALSVSMLKDVSSGKYDAKELMTSANYILANKDNSREFRKMTKELGCDINEFRHILAEKVCEEGYGETDFRKKKRNGEKLLVDVSPIAGETGDKFDEREARTQSACALAEKALKDYETDNVGYDTSLGVDGNEEGYNLDKVDISRVMALDAATSHSSAEFKERKEAELAEKIKRDRQKRNTDEQNLLFEFSKQGKEMHKEVYEKTYQGMTKDEWIKKREYDASNARKEALRTALTVGASIEGGILGSSAAIGIGENGGVIQEAAAGIFGGAVAGDALAETVTSDGTVKKKIKKINPYTGEEVEVEITTWGGFSDGELESTTSDVGAKLSKKLDEQFLMQKVQRDRQFADARRKKAEDSATREKLTEAYRKAVEDAQNSGNNNT